MAVAEIFGAGADAKLAVQRVLRISAIVISAAYCQSQPGRVIFAGKVVAGNQNVSAVVKFMINIEQSIGFYTAVIFVIFVFIAFFVVQRCAKPSLQAVGAAAFYSQPVDVAEGIEIDIAVSKLHLRCP